MSNDPVNLKHKSNYQSERNSSANLRPRNISTQPVTGLDSNEPPFLPSPGSEPHLKAIVEEQLKLIAEDGYLQWHWKWVWRWRPEIKQRGWGWQWVFEELKVPTIFKPRRY